MRHVDLPTLSERARLLVIAGVFAGAILATVLMAVVFVSGGSAHESANGLPVAASATPQDRESTRPTGLSKRGTTKPTATHSPTVKASPASPSPTKAVARRERPVVSVVRTDSWSNGFVGVVTVANTTKQPVRWALSFDLRNAEIDDSWQAQLNQDDSGIVQVSGHDWNAVVQPGERVQFGFRAVGTDRPRIRDCTLNGEPCRLRR